MSRRSVGALFCCVAAGLFLSRYILAIWYRGPAPTIWGREEFSALLAYIGIAPWVVAGGFLLVGIGFLFLSERDQ
jgi:hypothetical protein